jgi:hypothetical protein
MRSSPRVIWHKSSYSHGESGDCVELAAIPDAIGIRDTKNRGAGHLQISKRDFVSLLNEVKTGRHDL